MTGARRLAGTVVRFDEAVGLGDIVAVGPVGEVAAVGAVGGTAEEAGLGENGSYPFHCTQIADGSRTVAVGTRVSFGLLAGRAGRWEAADIEAATE